MDEQLKNALKDEKILWQGKAEDYVLMDKTHKPLFIRKLIIGIVVSVILSVGYYVVAKDMVKPFLIAVIWAVALYAAFAEMLGAKKVKKLDYILTDKRCVINNDGTLADFEYAKVDSYKFVKDDDGHTCLLVGADAEKDKMYNWRRMPVESFRKNVDTGKVEKAGLYAIAGVDSFRRIFAEQMKK